MAWWVAYGRRLAHRSTAWLVLTSLAVTAFVLAWSGLVVAAASYDGRFVRTEARTAVEAATPAEAEFQYAPIPSTSGLQQVWVIYVRPIRQDAPLPPGVSRWPQPGESVLSPAAQAALAAPGSWSSWSPGTVVGLIAPDGLATPTEALAYVNPPAGAILPADVWSPSRSFGGSGIAGWGDVQSLYEWPLFVLLYVPTIAVPATLLLAGVWLAGSRSRRRAERVLVMLGATAQQRAALRLSAVALPWGFGAALAAAVISLASVIDVVIPYVEYSLLAVDLRRWAGPLVIVWLVTVLVSLFVLQSQAPARKLIRTRRRDRPGPVQWVGAAVGFVSVVGAVPLLNLSGLEPDAVGYLTMAALILAVLTMPALCAVTVWLVVRLLRRSRGVGTTVGVGLLRQGRGPVAALAGTIGSSLCLLTVVNVYVSTPGPFAEARPVYAASIGHVVTVGSSRLNLSLLTDEQWKALTHGADRVVLAIAHESDENLKWELYADGAALRGTMHGETCRLSKDTPTALRYALSSIEIDSCPRAMRTRPTQAANWQLTLYRADGKLDPSTVSAAVAAWIAPPPSIDVPASAYVSSGPLSSKTQLRWIPWCASVGLLLMLGALLQFAAGDLQHAQRRIAGYLILGASDMVAGRAMALRLALPVAIAIGYGSIFSLQRPMIAPDRPADYSIDLFLAYAGVIMVGIVAAVAVNTAGAKRHLRAWRPGKGRE